MMRSILIAAVMGVLAAVPASYFLTAPARQDRPQRRPAQQCWVRDGRPCRSVADLLDYGGDGGNAGLGGARSGFRSRQASDRAGDWEAAIKALTNAGLRDARNADIQNHLATPIAACGSSVRQCVTISRR